MVNGRVERLRNKLLNSKNSLSVERAKLLTESMKKTEGEPVIIRWAKAIRHILEDISISIAPDELIVGNIAGKPPGAIFYPELSGFLLVPELDNLRKREVNPLFVTDEEISIIKEEIFPYWWNKNIASSTVKLFPREMVRVGSAPTTVLTEAAGITLEGIVKFTEKHAGLVKRGVARHGLDKKILGRAVKLFPKEVGNVGSMPAVFILTEFAGISHTTVNYPYLLSTGLREIIKEAEKRDGEFYEAVKIALEGIIKFADRCAELAEKLSKDASGNRKKELKEIAEVCRRVPAYPPRTFHEALQFVWFFQIALHQENYEQGISIGRIDQFLLPYYRKDVEEGGLDREMASELIQCLWIKTSEIIPALSSLFSQKFFGGLLTNQAVTVGGVDKDGRDATNELSCLILEATDELRLRQPNLIVRLSKKTTEDFRDKVSEVINRGGNVLSVFNDDIAIPALCKRSVSVEDARDYSVTGCVEPTSAGKTFGSTDATLFNIAICFELALNNGRSRVLKKQMGPKTGNPRNFKSVDDVISAFRKQVSHFVKRMADGSNFIEIAHQKMKPTPVMSVAIYGCFEAGRDVTSGAAKYNFTGVQVVGIADVADSLAAIEKFVFSEKSIKMREMLFLLAKNFDGAENMRLRLWGEAPKYGNDDEVADKYARLVARMYAGEVEKYKNPRGGKFVPGIYSIGTQVGFGEFVGALPSGRRAKEPLATGISPHHGCDVLGPTAAMKSVAKVESELFANGISYDMKINPKLSEVKVLSSLIKTYFELGGMHVMFNIIDRDTLIDAQLHPEKYQDLLVRVGGFSARFIDLGKEHQDEIIKRTEHNA
jgi:formate C-acetyltransferase